MAGRTTAEEEQSANEVTRQDGRSGVVESSPVSKADADRARRGTFYALSFRNFRLFFFGQLISVAGTWMQSVAEQWLIYSLTHSAAWLGIVSGASALPYVALTLFGGQVADRVPRRTILICTQGSALTLAAILAILASNRVIPIQAWHIVALAAMLGVVNAFNMPAQQAFVTDMVEGREALANAITLNSLQFNIARVLGPIFAGWVLIKVGAFGCFTVNAFSFVAVIASLLLMQIPPRARKPEHNADAAPESVWDGFRYIGHTVGVLRIVSLVGSGSLFLWSSSTLYPVFATQFGQGAHGYTAMMSANGVGAALGGLTLARIGDRLPRRYAIYGGSASFAVSLLLLTFAPNWPLVLAALVFGGTSMMMLGINSNTYVQQQVPDRLRGRVMAVYSLVFGGLMPLGGLETGFVAEHFSAAAAIRFNSSVALVVTVALFIWSQLTYQNPTEPPLSSRLASAG